ncbi:XRE family transcriptional regulator [Mycobacterium sp. MMS18-G62]
MALNTTARRAQPAAALQEVRKSQHHVLEDRPIEHWPTSAIRAALMNATSDVMRRVTTAVNRDPYGRTAHQVEEIVRSADAAEPVTAIAAVLADARARLEAAERSEVTHVVHVLLKRSRLSEHEFAKRIGVSAGELSAFLDNETCPSAVLMVRMKRVADRFSKAGAQRRTQP